MSLSSRLQTETISSRSYLHLGNSDEKNEKICKDVTSTKQDVASFASFTPSASLLHPAHSSFQVFFPSSSQPVFESINADCVQRVHEVLLHFNGQKSHACNACIQKIDRT